MSEGAPQIVSQEGKIKIEDLVARRDKIDTEISLMEEMIAVGLTDESASTFLEQAERAYDKLTEKGVKKELAVTFASLDIAVASSKFTDEEAFDAARSEFMLLIKHLIKNPALKTDENAEVVIGKTIALRRENHNLSFIDALFSAAYERDVALPGGDLYIDASGVVSTNPGDFREGEVKTIQ